MSQLRPPLNDRDHARGDRSAPIVIVEFGDFECPFCAQAYVVLKSLEESLGDRLCVAFRHFPITQAHPHALMAAEAAEAAGAQGKFWEMHDVLFEHQDALTNADFLEYAGLIGLDAAAFERDLRRQELVQKIRGDVRSGALSGVNGTPTLFINGARHDGAVDFLALGDAMQSVGEI